MLKRFVMACLAVAGLTVAVLGTPAEACQGHRGCGPPVIGR